MCTMVLFTPIRPLPTGPKLMIIVAGLSVLGPVWNTNLTHNLIGDLLAIHRGVLASLLSNYNGI